jgi:hypothetical protein
MVSAILLVIGIDGLPCPLTFLHIEPEPTLVFRSAGPSEVDPPDLGGVSVLDLRKAIFS